MKESRVLVDSSAIIALASVGELTVLKDIFGEVQVTHAVRDEILIEGYPETENIREAVGEWIEVIEVEEAGSGGHERQGLGEGELSLIAASRGNDRLILDDPLARRVAEVEGLEFTGLIGLLVESCRAGLIPRERGRRILEDLSASNFRMTAELYNWGMKRLEGKEND